MLRKDVFSSLDGIDFKVTYSRRRSIAISIKPDASVIVRVPYLTSMKTIERIVSEKSDWIIRHRNNYINNPNIITAKKYVSGESHLFRGNPLTLITEQAKKSAVLINSDQIVISLPDPDDIKAVKRILYTFYKEHAVILLPGMFLNITKRLEHQKLTPNKLIIRTMKRRWGSCSNKGVITLSTELIKLADKYIEYVIVHELCHLRHHNHGEGFYRLLSELYPDWKEVRREMKKYVQ
jgi:predicted metal-dependent hydrolase